LIFSLNSLSGLFIKVLITDPYCLAELIAIEFLPSFRICRRDYYFFTLEEEAEEALSSRFKAVYLICSILDTKFSFIVYITNIGHSLG
jgi:hypothetical protein